MVYHRNMSREDPQMKIRLPADLKDSIEAAAKELGRSMNAEIVARLEETFAHPRDRIPGTPEEIKAFAEGVAQALVEKGWVPAKKS